MKPRVDAHPFDGTEIDMEEIKRTMEAKACRYRGIRCWLLVMLLLGAYGALPWSLVLAFVTGWIVAELQPR